MIDLDKLELPWHADESWLVRLKGDTLRNTPGFAKFEGEHRNDEAAFAAAVSQMVEILMRRGWGVLRLSGPPAFQAVTWEGHAICGVNSMIVADNPVTAVLEADRWYKANCE